MGQGQTKNKTACVGFRRWVIISARGYSHVLLNQQISCLCPNTCPPTLCVSSLPAVEPGDGMGREGHRVEVGQHWEPGGSVYAQEGTETQVPL